MQIKPLVLYQDHHIIVACKPYGLLSEQDEKKPNMPALLREEACCDVYPLHRLDRTTQGVMVYAKSPAAAKRMSVMIQEGGLEKMYLAAVEGVPAPLSGEYADLLYYDRQKNKSYVVKRERKGVKKARLCYETLETSRLEEKKVSLLRIRLLTGRTHQIRVQLASRKMPLIGDRRYGSGIVSENIALCAVSLRFAHPFTGEAMRFDCTPDSPVFDLFKA